MNSQEFFAELNRQIDEDDEKGYQECMDDTPLPEDEEEARELFLERLEETQRRLWRNKVYVYCNSDLLKNATGDDLKKYCDLDEMLKQGAEFGIKPEFLEALKNFKHEDIRDQM